MNNIVIITSYLDTFLDIKNHLDAVDYIICTDGGYDIALSQKIRPDLLLGDFDSIEASLPEDIEIKQFEPEKDFTDLELALKTAVELNASEVTVIGGIGGRLDHTVANLQLLCRYSTEFDKFAFIDGKTECFALSGNHKNHAVIHAKENTYISIFSLSEKCTGVIFKGVKYPLNDHTLTRTFPLGVSNEFKEKDAVLSLKDGTLLVIITDK